MQKAALQTGIKRALALGLACVLGVMACAGLGYNANTGSTIEYGNILGLVEQNLEVKKAKTTASSSFATEDGYQKQLREAQDSYAEAERTYLDTLRTIRETSEALNLSEDAYEALVDVVDGVWESQKESIESGIESVQDGITAVRFSQQSATLAVVSTKQQQVNAAHQAFLNHFSLLEKKAVVENQLENLKWQISLAEIKLKRKLIPQISYDTLVDSLSDIELAMENYDTALKQNELQLKAALGIAASASIRYGKLPDVSAIEQIPLRDRNVDRDAYLSRSLVIENARIGINKAQSTVDGEKVETYYEVDNALLSYEQSVESVTQQFESTYGALQDSYLAYNNAVKAHNSLKSEYSRLLKKQKKGQASKNAVRTKKDQLLQSQYNLKAQKIELYSQFQLYLNGLTL